MTSAELAISHGGQSGEVGEVRDTILNLPEESTFTFLDFQPGSTQMYLVGLVSEGFLGMPEARIYQKPFSVQGRGEVFDPSGWELLRRVSAGESYEIDTITREGEKKLVRISLR